MLGRVTRRKVCQPPAPSTIAASSSSLPCCSISGMSWRATNGQGDEDRREHEAGQGEDDLDVVRREDRAEPALGAEQQHEDHAGDHRRHREGQVDDRGQQALAAELELGDAPGRGDAEDRVDRHDDRGDQERQADGGEGVGRGEGRPIGVDALGQGLGEHQNERQDEQQGEDRHCRHDEGDPDGAAFAERAARSHVVSSHVVRSHAGAGSSVAGR